MLYMHGIGHFHPENVIDNAFLESLDIGTSDDWIVERVGIRKRRTVLPLDYIRETRNSEVRGAREASLYSNAQTGAKAATMAIDRAGIAKEDIGLVIAGGCSPQWSSPAESCIIAAELDIEAPCFDISSACSTFAAQLTMLSNNPGLSPGKFILMVQPENNTRCIDYNDRNGAVLWGDATTAAVVSCEFPSPVKVHYTTMKSDPKGWDKVYIPIAGHFEQDGRAVQGFAIRKGTEVLKQLRDHCLEDPEQLKFIGHQANLLVLEGICRKGKIDAEHHLHNVADYGNCGASGAPSILSQRWDEFKEGDEVAVAVVGAGLTWGGALFQFGSR